MLQALLCVAAWSPQGLAVDRRALLRGAAAVAVPALATPFGASAIVSDIGKSGLTKEEFYKALSERKEAERIAGLPINRLKVLRTHYDSAQPMVDSGDWASLRDLIRDTTGPDLRTLQKEGKFMTKDVLEATSKLRKLMFEVDTFAYSQQDFPGSDVFAGYCAEGVVPRETGGCKAKPAADKSKITAQLKEGKVLYDKIIKSSEGA